MARDGGGGAAAEGRLQGLAACSTGAWRPWLTRAVQQRLNSPQRPLPLQVLLVAGQGHQLGNVGGLILRHGAQLRRQGPPGQ